MDKIHFFTQEQGNLLIRLLLAHILADFILQPKTMAANKNWRSPHMLKHIAIVGIMVFLMTFSLTITLVISSTHYIIDSAKVILKNEDRKQQLFYYTIDQFLHVLVIIVLCIYKFELFDLCYENLTALFLNYQLSLYLLAYGLVIWPLGYFIKFFLERMMPQDTTGNVEHGGKLIGQFERIIILTFVLLGQYEAIGFLITGKSIIRFADRDPEVKSEYVLVGTMMSYALSILIGIGFKVLSN